MINDVDVQLNFTKKNKKKTKNNTQFMPIQQNFEQATKERELAES